jgi:phenylacetate-CoA ligase
VNKGEKTMTDLRTLWRETIRKYQYHPEKPGSETHWCPELETCPRDKLKEMQSEKLEICVRYMYEYSQFYHERFKAAGLTPADIRSVADLPKIPITTKAEMSADVTAYPPWGRYTAVDEALWASRGWMLFNTSGTTAAPRAFRYTQLDREIWAWADARAMWAMGVRPGDRVMIAFGYGPHVFLWGAHHAFYLLGVSIIPGGGLDSHRRALFINTYRPTILACTPSYALFLGQVMREMGFDPATSSVRFLLCGGEPASGIPATRKRLQELWGAELHEFYGCTEAAPYSGAHTCHWQVGRTAGPVSPHLMEDLAIWEVVDPKTLAPVAEGERGIAVVTNLCSEASPQIRFLVGDYTTLSPERCGCDRIHTLALGGFYGRADDMLNIRGVTLFPSTVEDALRALPELEDEFEIVLTQDKGLDVFTVVVESRVGIAEPDSSALQRKVENAIMTACELRPAVQVKPPGTLPKTEFKARRIRDLRSR